MDAETSAHADAELTSELRDGVLWLTINRPEASNSIPFYVRDRLIDHFRDAHTDLAVRCVVLTAAGDRHFCTGSDLRVRPPAPPKPDGAPDFVAGSAVHMMRAGFQQLMERMQDCQKPIIVALNGTAAGGGAMLTLAADLVIAADTAKIVDVFSKQALIPDGGYLYLLPRIVGTHKAAQIVFLGDSISATEAAELGIVNRVVPAADLRTATAEWADRIAAKPTKVLGWAKKLLHDATEIPRTATLENEAVFIELNLGTEDGKERMAAMMEKRDPVWRGF
ncbi:MAG: enoyl-CoA hydratase/isomerase family protein [Acidimicrobiia bacterium]|nr:enoyl-CoA hydratase/isomerase family protein [Acidimicrobiia bacterium]